MLKILRCGHSRRAKNEINDEICSIVKKREHALMIVPEQQTVVSELELAELLPSYSPLYFEVTNFSRLSNTVFRALGGISGEYCDNSVKALIMWRTLTELSPVLSMTRGRSEISSGLVETALASVKEMQSLSVTAEDLIEMSQNEAIKADKRLSSKLSDLSKIYSLYKKLLSEKYSDTGEAIEVMIEKLRESPDFLKGYSIFLDGFTSFTEPQYKLIGLLMGRASVSVSLPLTKIHRDFFEYTEIKDTEERLTAIARKSDCDIKLLERGGIDMGAKESISLLIDRIWRKFDHFDNICLQDKEEIRIFEAKNPFEECDFIASDIKRRVMNGDSYRDFAIIARDEKSYLGILDSALSLAAIPFFSSAKRDIESYEIIKLIYSAYAAIRSSFAREDVLTYAKCALSGIGREECDRFESYVETWQISGSRFTSEQIWNMNPSGYDTKRSSRADGLLKEIHETRMKLISPLMLLKENSEAAKTVKEQATVLYSFLVSVDAERGLRLRAEKLARLGEAKLAEENKGLWKLIVDSLNTLVSLSGDCECCTDSFLSQLKILFFGVDMGRIPAYYDEVTVGSADMLRISPKKHIYLLGVNAGEFPATPADNSYLTERDKEELSESGYAIKPEMEIKGARELYFFSRAISYAKDSVTFLYASQSPRFKSTEPSEVIKKITELTGGAVSVRVISDLSVKEREYVAKSLLNETNPSENGTLRASLSEAGYGDRLSIREGDIRNTDLSLTKSIIKQSDSLNLSQSRIDSFVKCPFAYFCKYTVSLSPEKRAEFDASGVGSLIHAILENFFKALAEKNMKAKDIDSEERVLLTRRAAEKYIYELGESITEGAARTKIKIERLCRAALPVVEGLCEEFSKSLFSPKFFELSINEEDPDTPDSIVFSSEGGRRIVIGGIIDRVDTFEKDGNVYVRVVDYKTGKKEFSPEDLAEGKNLQMFLYLHSIITSKSESFKRDIGVKEGGRMIPAGVVYLKTFIGDKNIPTPDDTLASETVKDEQKRLGMLIDDEEIIRAMDIKYTPLYNKRLKDPYDLSKVKGELLFSEEGFSEIMNTVRDSVLRVADGMSDGIISAEPKIEGQESACDYCEYKPICRNVKIVKKR